MKYEIIKNDNGKAERIEFENYRSFARIPARMFQYLVERKGQEIAISRILKFVYENKFDNSKKRSFDTQVCINLKPVCDHLGYSLIRTKNKIKLLKHGKE